MIIHIDKLTINTIAGEGSVNTSEFRGICHNLLVKSASVDTSFDISITDQDDITIYERISEQGEISEITVIPLRGIYTVSILNATKDEKFTIKLVIKE